MILNVSILCALVIAQIPQPTGGPETVTLLLDGHPLPDYPTTVYLGICNSLAIRGKPRLNRWCVQHCKENGYTSDDGYEFFGCNPNDSLTCVCSKEKLWF
jgi:hypothetical protein